MPDDSSIKPSWYLFFLPILRVLLKNPYFPDPNKELYPFLLLQLFQFARTHKGTYDGECPFYCSFSGYNVISLSISL